MSKQPDRRRLTMWEQRPTPQPRTQHRWSAPVQPTASLIQPGYTDLGPRPQRPLRAPAYPLSSRPFLSKQASTQRNPPTHILSQQAFQQTSEQTPTQQATPQQTTQRRPRLWTRVRRLSRLFRLSRRENTQAQASPLTSSSPSTIISPPEPSHSSPLALEDPRPAPLPPPAAPPSSPEQSVPELPIVTHNSYSYTHTNPHAPANRRPLSVPVPLRDATSPADARSSLSSLQLRGLALCSACSRVRHCVVGLGAGRVICTECLRQHFIDSQD